MLTIYYSPGLNTSGATSNRLITNKGVQSVWKSAFNPIILNDRYQHAAVDILDKTGEHPCTACHLRMHLIVHRDRTFIKRAEPISSEKLATRPLL